MLMNNSMNPDQPAPSETSCFGFKCFWKRHKTFKKVCAECVYKDEYLSLYIPDFLPSTVAQLV